MPMNMAGRIAKYLAISLAMENVVSAPRVMSSCLPMATTSMSLVGLLSRSTILPASLAAMVPVFIARPTSAWARAGASLVPSPVMATRRPPACSFLIDRKSVVEGSDWSSDVCSSDLHGAGVHRQADIGLGEGWGVVGAVTGHGDEASSGLLLFDQVHLVLGGGLGEEIVHSRFGRDGGGGQRVIAGDRSEEHTSELQSLRHLV